MKKIVSLILAAVMLTGMSVASFADITATSAFSSIVEQNNAEETVLCGKEESEYLNKLYDDMRKGKASNNSVIDLPNFLRVTGMYTSPTSVSVKCLNIGVDKIDSLKVYIKVRTLAGEWRSTTDKYSECGPLNVGVSSSRNFSVGDHTEAIMQIFAIENGESWTDTVRLK